MKLVTNEAPLPAAAPKQSRMTLGAITRGMQSVPFRVVVYGMEGVGKSTFAAGAPSPVFLCSETGTSYLDVARFPEPRTWQDALDAIETLAAERHDFQSIVIDTVNWLEPLCWLAVTKGECSIEEYQKGYGRGYVAALDRWREFLSALEVVWRRGMHVILLAHTHAKGFADPTGGNWDRYELAMHKGAAGAIKQWADFVLFAREETFVKTGEDRRVRGVSTGARYLHTRWHAAYDAKSRVELPDEIPLGWDEFVGAVRGASEREARLLAQVEADLAEIGDEAYAAKVREYVNTADGKRKLAEVANKVAAKKGQSNG